jgi:hypothetical protein
MTTKLMENSPGPMLLARAEIAERMNFFSLLTVSLTARDTEELLAWLEGEEFTATCITAKVNAEKVAGKFHQLIKEGINRNVRIAHYETS